MSLSVTVTISILRGASEDGEQVQVATYKEEATYSDIRALALESATNAERALGGPPSEQDEVS